MVNWKSDLVCNMEASAESDTASIDRLCAGPPKLVLISRRFDIKYLFYDNSTNSCVLIG